MNKQLIEKMVRYRAKNNLTQEEFAKRCNLSTLTICLIENGKTSPTKLTLGKILNVLDRG